MVKAHPVDGLFKGSPDSAWLLTLPLEHRVESSDIARRRLHRREILFRLHLTPYREAVLPAGMREGVVMGCLIGDLSIPVRTALRLW